MFVKKAAIVALFAACFLGTAPAANASPSANCIGQFFSEHAGIVPATGGQESVGGFIAPTAREIRREFGMAISSARTFPRDACGL